LEAWPNNQTAWEYQAKLDQLHKLIGSASKYVMKMLGVDLGPPRLPQYALSQDVYNETFQSLQAFGFFNQTWKFY